MTIALAVIAVVAVALMIIFPAVGRMVKAFLILAITLGASAVAICGFAILMNNVAINDQPGISSRIYRFLTVNWAATSAKGIGLVSCDEAATNTGLASNAALPPAARPRHAEQRAERGQPTSTASPATGASNPEEDVYPELVRRGYPGLSRAKLFALAKETVNELGGWNVVKEEPRAYTLECSYTSRPLKLQDQIKIVVTPRSEIDLCSHSGTGEPGSGLLERLFSGDFGANIGHIKQFYIALEPKVDQAYREQEHKQGQSRY